MQTEQKMYVRPGDELVYVPGKDGLAHLAGRVKLVRWEGERMAHVRTDRAVAGRACLNVSDLHVIGA